MEPKRIEHLQNGGYRTLQDIPVPQGREIEEGWTSELVIEYDKNGNEVKRYWRSACMD